MNTARNAAPVKHHNDGPPRLNSTRCATYHNVATGYGQSSSGVARQPEGQTMIKTTALATREENPVSSYFNPQQIDILKNSICKGVSDDEFKVFLMACQKTQLDPFMKQIYAVKRKSKKPDGSWGETMTIQTGIDGYRLIAERTERYAPGPEPTYITDQNGNLLSATAYIKKQTKDGTWHTVSASAPIEEYMQTTVDHKTGEKRPTGMWVNMPKTMLSKCAEAQALRKAFPAEMSGVYTKEEMQQADYQEITISSPPVQRINKDQASDLEFILSECSESYRLWVYDYLKTKFNVNTLIDLPLDMFDKVKRAAVEKMEYNHSQQRAIAAVAIPDLTPEEPEMLAAEVR